jgi:hypothetical protein
VHGGRQASRALPSMMTPEDRREYNLTYKKKIEDGYDPNDARDLALNEWQMGRVYDLALSEDKTITKGKAEKEARELSYLETLLKKLKRR